MNKKFGIDSEEVKVEDAEVFNSEAKSSDFNFGITEESSNKIENKFLSIFKTQSIKFWIYSYLFSYFVYWFNNTYYYRGSLKLFSLNGINLILFPFAIIVLGELSVQFFKKDTFLYNLFYPSINKISSFGILTMILFFILKLSLYRIVWSFSFIIGIVGVLLNIYYSKKIN